MPLIHGETRHDLHCPPVIQVPDGVTADEARQILADHRPWVPLEDALPDGRIPRGVRVREEYTVGETSPVVYIHPDDVHTDPDADLIERMSAAVLENFHGPDERHSSWWLNPNDVARAALAVVREADLG